MKNGRIVNLIFHTHLLSNCPFSGSMREGKEKVGLIRCVIVAARLQAGRSGVRMRTEARDFSAFQNIQNSFAAHPASY